MDFNEKKKNENKAKQRKTIFNLLNCMQHHTTMAGVVC